ncbi:uncharacterized protein LOC103569414 [Microplitis demolitor]|uniref:uncharacterized protein LOC103569414 n=1 Tax=Microplitis demolitor TaxID=69319 RepID=UPI0004CD4807|nr:uncharacterized protein LOC103569414 [Microplitis demolitor]
MLSPDKSKSTYFKFLKVLKESIPSFAPKLIMIDFEEAVRDALKITYPDIHISGCNFHYNQCLWRHIQLYGLQRQYNTDVNFAANIKLLTALAFISPEDVVAGYEMIISSDFYDRNSDVLEELIKYFESVWIGQPCYNRRKRNKPKFEIGMWNCYQAVLDNLLRSNNPTEGWHNGFNTRVAKCNASIGLFVNCLKDEQSKTEQLIAQIDSGLDISNKRKAYRDYDKRLHNIVKTIIYKRLQNYDSNDKLSYLKNIAKIIAFKS